MKLSEKPKRPGGRTSGMREVLVARKQYRISLNAYLLRDLGITGGERILIAKDTDSRNDWYIAMTEDGGSKVRISQRNGNGDAISAIFVHKAAATEILDSVRATVSAVFFVASRPVKTPDGRTWYRIMTATPKRIR